MQAQRYALLLCIGTNEPSWSHKQIRTNDTQATPIIGQTENNVKTTQKTLKVLPEVIIYDVNLTLTLPAQMTITSGMNAIAHAVEALYSPEANPVIDLLAEQGVASIARALPIIHEDSQNLEARSDALYGAWACGTW